MRGPECDAGAAACGVPRSHRQTSRAGTGGPPAPGGQAQPDVHEYDGGGDCLLSGLCRPGLFFEILQQACGRIAGELSQAHGARVETFPYASNQSCAGSEGAAVLMRSFVGREAVFSVAALLISAI